MDSSDFLSILEDQQRKYLSDFHQKKNFQLTNLVNEETWVQAKVQSKDQELTNKINSLDSAQQDEERKTAPDNADPSDFLISTSSGDKTRSYKIVASLVDFQGFRGEKIGW